MNEGQMAGLLSQSPEHLQQKSASLALSGIKLPLENVMEGPEPSDEDANEEEAAANVPADIHNTSTRLIFDGPTDVARNDLSLTGEIKNIIKGDSAATEDRRHDAAARAMGKIESRAGRGD